MLKLILIVLTLATIVSCRSKQKVFINGKYIQKLVEVPGCVQIDSNLFADSREVRNIDWREYQYWMGRVFWEEGIQNTLPDSSSWRRFSDSLSLEYTLNPNIEMYYRHPSYNTYPIVGVSYEQVVNYCKWRTDRVFESFLIKKGIIPVNPDQVHEEHFSVENYFNGKYLGKIPDFSIPYCAYRLPSKEEWEFLAYGGMEPSKYPYGIDLLRKDIQKDLNKDSLLFRYFHLTIRNNEVLKDSIIKHVMPSLTSKTLANNFGLYSMHDNVSEMVQEKGLAKGGSFASKMAFSQIKKDFSYDTTKAWLGFRCVAEWKFWNPIN